MFPSRSTSNDLARHAPPSAMQTLLELALEQIVPNPSQPRRRFEERALRELAGSIRERGVLQPVLVRPRGEGMYELVAGERRWRAAKIAGRQTLPALVSPCDDREALEAGLIENVAREDLNPVEEARAFATLSNEFGLTYQQIGDRVGRHRVAVSHLTRLLQLPSEVLELLERGELSEGHGRALLVAKDQQVRQQLAHAAIEQGWSTLELERRARASKLNVLPPGNPEEQRLDQGQVRDQAALHLATAWGDLLGAEVNVRVMPRGWMRLEVAVGSVAEALALADQLGAAIARGSKNKGGTR